MQILYFTQTNLSDFLILGVLIRQILNMNITIPYKVEDTPRMIKRKAAVGQLDQMYFRM